ncbi:Rrf2 family transcriptional regulator [Methylocystis sp. MJC1]|jgi:Rrf2 family protein|uniref:RrF2 family transcriptional regulator n=1 Tax=Methylocystis sp. MJC1 TaxID=2654282 RepID=UPI0013EAA852|nr:Rrf2 family transcriptional regulator [Methylocystis sp. MJC1]KAF2989507.1 HTH-type transcriptional regulator IscR [Methylocystis sp. MJC1]MBU6527903.1 Rrf2 family transcriptional regulator [Methylocystis sp. MJC1]UZX10825.1 Rrf2 family transcriptional regulator [Methylocystis sp. MJC1]
MRLLPRPARFALMAALDVALYARGRPVSSKELAARHDLPPRRLETLLQALVRAGILKSVRGPAGGYELARERRRLCIGEIVRVALRAEEEEDQAPALLIAVLEPLIAETEEAALARLDDITLEDLYTRAIAQGFGQREPATDFDI